MLSLATVADNISWLTVLVLIADWLIRIGLSIRVIMRRTGVGESLSWLIVILIVPFAGAVIYLIVGENRLGSRRAQRTRQLYIAHAGWRSSVRGRFNHADHIPTQCLPIHRQAQRMVEVPALPGNQLELLTDSHTALRSLINDIDAATQRCHLEFYIWSDGGEVDEVADALIRAAERGVECRVLVDALGSKAFLRGSEKIEPLRTAGVCVVESLPAGLFRALFRRLDLRNHRKLAVIDGRVAYTGSLNMIDPSVFKSDAGVGAWIDAMVRVEGPAVEALATVFLEDWQLETDEEIERLAYTDSVAEKPQAAGAAVQVVPSGPTLNPENIHRLLIAAIYSAQKQITLTTPYFVPDESLLIALTSAAARGVDTLVILPAQNDSALVRHASNAYLGELLAAGVKVAKFREGLLHTKSVTVDDHLTAFGTVNLDMRSFHLNFELTLLVYDRDFTRRVTSLQQSYLMNCNMATLEAWQQRSFRIQMLDNTARLLGPLL